MKNLSALILLVIILISCGQTETKSEENKLTINKETVNQIYITGYCGPLDTCIKSTYRLYLLDDTMAENLIDKLNNSISKDPCNFAEYSSEYVLYIHLKDGTKKDFKIIGQSIKEDNDRCFDIHDTDYFEKIWSVLDNKWIELNKN